MARARSPRSSVEAGQKCFKLREKNKATFFSPSENRRLPASTLQPEEREFIVDSGASMHMISKKDLSDAEMDTLTKSCSPTIVITANGEVQTHEEAIVYVKEMDIFLTMKVLENTPAVLSLGKLCDENGYSYEWINGQKPHLIKNGIRIQCNTENFVPIVVPGLSRSSSSGSYQSTSKTPSRQESNHPTSSSSSSTSPTGVSSDSETREVPVSSPNVEDMIEREDALFAANPGSDAKPTKNLKTIKRKPRQNGETRLFAAKPATLCSEIPEWLQEFRENLVDDEIPVHRDSHASSSYGSSLGPTRSADLGKHSVHTHFPKDRNCEICITWAPCRRRVGRVVPRAENFGDLITADHKVLSEGCEFRNNHRYAIVVQDLATQWFQ